MYSSYKGDVALSLDKKKNGNNQETKIQIETPLPYKGRPAPPTTYLTDDPNTKRLTTIPQGYPLPHKNTTNEGDDEEDDEMT